MKNLNVPVKSRGVVLFAFNTDTVNYVRIAEQATRLIEYKLKLPVTVITNNTNTQSNYRTGYAHGSQWNNFDRYRAYELSPYDETILLDCDYVILDDNLLNILDSVDDYAVMSHNQNPIRSMDGDMGMMGLNYIWATAVVFKRSAKSKSLFDLVGRIQRNYDYYRRLYQLREENFRNDYAFTIADNIINGYTPSRGIPWTMLTIENPVKKIEIKNNMLVVREQDTAHMLTQQSLHIMDKDYLQSNDYVKFVDQICQN